MNPRSSAAFASPLATAIKAFVTHKRTVGRRYLTEELTLRLLDRYLIERGIRTIRGITSEIIDDFVAARPRKRPRSYNHLVGVLRVFFDWLVLRGVLASSPLRTAKRKGGSPRVPVILYPEHVKRLLALTSQLSDKYGGELRATTYRSVFALLYALGLRVGEVCRLCIGDIDQDRQLLVIRASKFGKTRLVPYGPKLAKILDNYMALRRKRYGPMPATMPVFSVSKQKPINRQSVGKVFRQLRSQLGMTIPSAGGPLARVHDLRHSFAVMTLLRWYRKGVNPADRIFHLSTFMGHVQPDSTAIYLSITNELLQIAAARFEETANATLRMVSP